MKTSSLASHLFRCSLAALPLAAALSVAACKTNEAAKAPEPEPTAAAAAPAPAAAAEPAPAAAAPAAAEASSIYPLKMNRLDGTPASLSEWSGKVLLIVNTASKCGHTPQYEGLQKLHAKYSPRGFAVLGFPSNDFGGQEPGTSQEIAQFCTSIYAVNFPMFEKVKVKGEERVELYTLLSKALGEPHWNFHKYLIDKQGRPVKAWESKIQPGSAEIEAAIEAQLGAS